MRGERRSAKRPQARGLTAFEGAPCYRELLEREARERQST